MAIYRFEAKLISRGGGRSTMASASYRTGKFANGGKSAVSAAAYRAGAQLTDERTGQRYDYTHKQGVLGAEIMVPDGAVPWMRNRQQLWAAVEQIEKRRDAQLARDFILTLPVELSHAQRVDLTREFVREQFCSKGLVADIAWHAPSRQGDDRNYHAHVMLPLRRIEGDGFARKKDRPAGPEHPAKAWATELAALRVAWAETANRHLEAAGLDIRIDHRSLAEQGIDREPEPKLGPLATQIERDGRESLAGNDNRDVKARNAELATLKADQALVAAEECRLVDLVVRRMRSGEMQPEPVTEEELRQQQAREDAALRELQQQEARQAFKRQADEQAEEAKKQQEQTAKDEARRSQEGEIASASARYSTALANHYDVRDPYGSLAKASMAEYAALVKGQEQLRLEAAKEPDAEKRRVIELRREIEVLDYMATSSQRLGGISATIAGNENAPQARIEYARAYVYAEKASELRDDRATMIADRARRDQEQQATPVAQAKPQDQEIPGTRLSSDRRETREMMEDRHSQEHERMLGTAVPPTDEMPAEQQRRQDQEDEKRKLYERGLLQDRRQAPPAPEQEQEKTARKDGEAPEMTDAKQAKRDRINATRALYAEHDAQKQKDRDRGGGGRSGR